MRVPVTEEAESSYRGLDRWGSREVLAAILAGQMRAVEVVEHAIPVLALAGDDIALRMRQGGRLIYAGAGTSGLLAQMDGLELPGTFGIGEECVKVLLAGGSSTVPNIPAVAEDNWQVAEQEIGDLHVGPLDCVIAVSASGSTPYTLAALQAAKACGALTVGIACNHDAPILAQADHAVLLATPPEVVAGSTRMGAGTAQKCALTMLSTLVGIRLGHVFEGMMVNLRAENKKLEIRATRIVANTCALEEGAAASLLDLAGRDVKVAIVLNSMQDGTPSAARRLLAGTGGNVRLALQSILDGA